MVSDIFQILEADAGQSRGCSKACRCRRRQRSAAGTLHSWERIIHHALVSVAELPGILSILARESRRGCTAMSDVEEGEIEGELGSGASYADTMLRMV